MYVVIVLERSQTARLDVRDCLEGMFIVGECVAKTKRSKSEKTSTCVGSNQSNGVRVLIRHQRTGRLARCQLEARWIQGVRIFLREIGRNLKHVSSSDFQAEMSPAMYMTDREDQRARRDALCHVNSCTRRRKRTQKLHNEDKRQRKR